MFLSINDDESLFSTRGGSFFQAKKDLCDVSGLIDRRRFIHIFHDGIMTDNVNVILINVSTSVGRSVVFSDFINPHNGVQIFASAYSFVCTLDPTGRSLNEQFMNSNCFMITSRRMDREVDHDTGLMRNDSPSIFSKHFDLYNTSDMSSPKGLPDPMFYTLEHQYNSTGEFLNGGILEDRSYMPTNYIGRELIDDTTTIYRRELANYHTMYNEIFGNQLGSLRGDDVGSIIGHPTEDDDITNVAAYAISDMNATLGMNCMVNGGGFIYDSMVGFGQYQNGMVIGAKYMTDKLREDEIDTFMTTCHAVARSIETQYGDIQFMFHPSLVGSKCKVILRAYNDPTIYESTGPAVRDFNKDTAFEVTEHVGNSIECGDGEFISSFSEPYHDQMEHESIIARFH